MLKFAHQSRFISLSAAAILISLVASLSACATLDHSTRSASAAPPSESFWGYRQDPADYPAGPSFWGYRDDRADHAAGRSFWGYYQDPTDHPAGHSFWGYYEAPAKRAGAATQAAREPQPAVAVPR